MTATLNPRSANERREPATQPVRVGSGPLLSAATADLAEHHRRNGPMPWQDAAVRLIGVLETAGLTGRGGAGFPMWRKLASVGMAERTVVIGNAAEGEPGSAKDRTLLIHGPHLVLDGLQLAAEAVGAAEVYLYVGAGPAEQSARRALAERAATGWDRLPVTVVTAPDTFVSGEESAVVAAVEGRAALPRDRTVRVAERGVRGRPTLVQNVETLAHLALIARHGPHWFRQRGTAEEPGTFLATLGGAVPAPGVYEAAYGDRLDALLAQAGGPREPVRAVLVGGYHGAWVPGAELSRARMSRESLRPYGASPGAGVVIALPGSACGLTETARITSYLAEQSAGQCGPCVNGLPAMADALTRLAQGDRRPELVAWVERLTTLTEGRGACRHPDGTVRLVRSGLRVFSDEVRLHLSSRCTVIRPNENAPAQNRAGQNRSAQVPPEQGRGA
ncbi:MAG TPA: NADH-ubiquinone oxidoreductase-F iron-sulfur binding region domain-containing protein [Pseudonocardiaceae bacterium]|jgi:NADH:ubiquinone oxidoreductase subunit F (NADH-binding)|nr:NADH-ubiquinone oxidoreductase-F iron-sulfur binding region domain-containing protein [Pseudonocardiaceae bacterium]